MGEVGPRGSTQSGGAEPLCEREQEIARLYADGLSYKEIARSLSISPATVRTHLNSIFRKLEVTTKVRLLRRPEAGAVRVPGRRDGAAGQVAVLPEGLGLTEHLPTFAAHGIEDALLPELTDGDLQAIGVSALGHRKRLLQAIADLRRRESSAPRRGLAPTFRRRR